MLDVDMVMMDIADTEELVGVAVTLTSSVDLQLHPQETGTLPIENGVWLVVIALDTTFPNMTIVAGLTIALIIISGQIAQIRILYHSPTLCTGHIIIICTVLTENDMLVTASILLPDTSTAVSADTCVLLQAVRAEVLAVKDGAALH